MQITCDRIWLPLFCYHNEKLSSPLLNWWAFGFIHLNDIQSRHIVSCCGGEKKTQPVLLYHIKSILHGKSDKNGKIGRGKCVMRIFPFPIQFISSLLLWQRGMEWHTLKIDGNFGDFHVLIFIPDESEKCLKPRSQWTDVKSTVGKVKFTYTTFIFSRILFSILSARCTRFMHDITLYNDCFYCIYSRSMTSFII